MGGRRAFAMPIVVAAAIACLPQPVSPTWSPDAAANVTSSTTSIPNSLLPKFPASTPAATTQAARAEPSARVDCRKAKCVALTYDDGPGPRTASIVKSLRSADARATFFVVGSNAKADPGMVAKLVASGMVVGDHSWDHPLYTQLSAKEQRTQTDRTVRAIQAAGAPRPTLFRPPYGAFNKATRKLGFPIILWDVDPEDWKTKNADATVRRVLKQTKRGSIVLLHDVVDSTASATPRIIRGLQAKGFTLVTVPELLGSTRAGTIYFSKT